MNTKRITIEVTEEVHGHLKLLAYAENKSLGSICRQALTHYCSERQVHKIRLVDER